MAGHSKWSNIKRRKNAQDAKRGKIFMQHNKNIYVAAKEGGGDIEMNPTLRTAVDKAKADNMPNENIDRAIKKATGGLEGVNYEEFNYEGYGPGGVAVIVQVLTDNRNRTAGEVRHAFNKNGGNLGESGSVSFMFDRRGYILILNTDNTISEDEITLEAIEAGAEDIVNADGAYEIYTTPEDYKTVCEHLQQNGYELEQSEVTYIPQTYTHLSGDQKDKMLNLLEMLENEEDTQDIHHNMADDE